MILAGALAMGLVAFKEATTAATAIYRPERPVPLVLTLLGERPPDWLLAHVKVGEWLRLRESNVPLGRIRAVRPRGLDVLIELAGDGHTSGDVLKVARIPLLIGDALAVRGADFAIALTVYDLAPARDGQ